MWRKELQYIFGIQKQFSGACLWCRIRKKYLLSSVCCQLRPCPKFAMQLTTSACMCECVCIQCLAGSELHGKRNEPLSLGSTAVLCERGCKPHWHCNEIKWPLNLSTKDAPLPKSVFNRGLVSGWNRVWNIFPIIKSKSISDIKTWLLCHTRADRYLSKNWFHLNLSDDPKPMAFIFTQALNLISAQHHLKVKV